MAAEAHIEAAFTVHRPANGSRAYREQQPDDQPATQSTRPLEQLDVAEPSLDGTLVVYPTGSKFWIAFITVCMVLFVGGLDANIVATAVPSITNHFHTVADVAWYSSAFRLSTCSFQFAFAKAYRVFSTKAVLIVTEVIFLAGSLLCATAISSAMLIIGRAIAGIGFAGALSGCFAVLVDVLPLEKRPAYAGFGAAVESVAIISAPIVGGALTSSLGWRWCFWITLPLGGLSLASVVFFFSNPRSSQLDDPSFAQKLEQLDLLSNCLLIPALTALFIALSWAGTKYAWSSGMVIGLLIAFIALFTGFLYSQYHRGDSAALPFRVIKNRSVLAGLLFTTGANSMTNVFEWYLPTYYQVVRSKAPDESGYLMVPILMGMLLGLLLQGVGTTTLGYYAPFMLFASVCMPIAAGLMTTFDLHTPLAKMILCPGFVGFSSGIGFQGPQSAVQTMLKPADVNLGIGVILFGQSLGPAVFIAVAHVIFINRLSIDLDSLLPEVTPGYIDEHGLDEITKAVPMERRMDVTGSIDSSLTVAWYLCIALGGITMVGSAFTKWRSVKQKES